MTEPVTGGAGDKGVGEVPQGRASERCPRGRALLVGSLAVSAPCTPDLPRGLAHRGQLRGAAGLPAAATTATARCRGPGGAAPPRSPAFHPGHNEGRARGSPLPPPAARPLRRRER